MLRKYSIEEIMQFDDDDGQVFVKLEDVLKVLKENLDYYGDYSNQGAIISCIIEEMI